MATLNVPFCIVCEDVRPETRGKYSILGFFGLLPHVHIKLQEMGKPLPKIVFLLNVEGDAGTYSFKYSLVGPNNRVLHTIPLPKMEINSDTTKRALGAINLQGLVFKKEGLYKIRLSHKNKVFYESTFGIAKGSPDLF